MATNNNSTVEMSEAEFLGAVALAGEFAAPNLRRHAEHIRSGMISTSRVSLSAAQHEEVKKAIKANKEIQKQSDNTAP